MMTKMSMSMSPEGFLMAKDHHRLMAGASGRMEKLLGSFPTNNSYVSSSESGDLHDLKEEEVWGTWPDGAGAGSDSVNSVTKDAENFRSKTEIVASEPVGRFTHHKQHHNQNGRQHQRRLGFETGGLSVAFEDSNMRSRFSPLTRTSKVTAAPPGRSMSVKMIPHAGDNNGGSNMRHMMHQSAPVNVPDWTKVLGMDHRKESPFLFSCAVNEDEDEERCDTLPPHEYLAREQARSQMPSTSVFHGVGRTLKGRDMSRVRNAVWRQTGFLG